MKYYSEITEKLYDDKKSLIADEMTVKQAQEDAAAKAKALEEEKQARHEEVEKAYAIAEEKYTEANKLLQAYLKDYGTFTSKNHISNNHNYIIDWFDLMFK